MSCLLSTGRVDGYVRYGGLERLAVAKSAANTFISQMNMTTDRVGLVSYSGSPGYPPIGVTDLVKDDYSPVNTSLNRVNCLWCNRTRFALKTAIDRVDAMPNTNKRAIRAIILMTDGNWNYNGTPMGRGTGERGKCEYFIFNKPIGTR